MLRWIIAITLVGLWVFLALRDNFTAIEQVDSCLNRGGLWNHEELRCEGLDQPRDIQAVQ